MIFKGLRRDLTFVSLSNVVRILEHFILNGPDSKVLDAILAQLNDPKRQNPQELDRAVIGKATFISKGPCVRFHHHISAVLHKCQTKQILNKALHVSHKFHGHHRFSCTLRMHE